MRLRHVIGAFAVSLLSMSCSLGDPGDAGSMNLYLAVDKGTLPLGESVTITVTARNVGYEDVSLTGPANCLLYVDVVDSQGRVLWTSNANEVCTNPVTQHLTPGADMVDTFVWDGTSLAGGRLASGFYHIRGVARVTGGAYIGPPLSISLE